MKIKYNFKNIMKIQQEAKMALVDTAEIAKTDLIQSQTMPFDTGTMQNNDSTFVDDKKVSKGKVYILSDTPYARKMYFHPEFNFKKDKNPNASGRWFDPYITGEKRDWLIKAYAKSLRRRVK